MKNVVIAGGSGFIGTALTNYLMEMGYNVSVLSRTPSKKNQFQWDIEKGILDDKAIKDVQILINLSGAGIAEKRWTVKRKSELLRSRTETNAFLYSKIEKMPHLEQFICSSGINSYGFDNGGFNHVESDPYGSDYLSQLVKSWEKSADVFQEKCKVAKIRTAIVLDKGGGALPKFIQPIRLNVGAILGNGKQSIPWIHLDDLLGIIAHIILKQSSGVFNAVAGNSTNKELTEMLAYKTNRKLWLPRIPELFIKLIFGEGSVMLLNGVCASNQKILDEGYSFKYSELERAIDSFEL